MGAAPNQALLDGDEGRYMRALKSVLGTTSMRETRRLPGRSMTFIEIIAVMLCAVKTRAEAAEGLAFPRALSGRPVHFHFHDDAQALADVTECYALAAFEDVARMAERENHRRVYGALMM